MSGIEGLAITAETLRLAQPWLEGKLGELTAIPFNMLYNAHVQGFDIMSTNGQKTTGQEPRLGGSKVRSRSLNLPGLGGNVGVMHLVEHLSCLDPQVRERALFELAKLGDDRALDGLLEIMQDDRDNRRRDRAIRSLGLLSDPRATRPLMEFVLRSTFLAASEQAAAIALKRICRVNPEVLDDVVSYLLANLSNDHRSDGAALMLGEIGDTRAIEPLIASLASPHYYIWRYSVYALGMIGKKHADTAPYILDTLTKHDLGERRQMPAIEYLAEAIAMIGMRHEDLAGQVVEALAKELKNQNWPKGYYTACLTIIHALGEIGARHASTAQSVISTLAPKLEQPDISYWERREAAFALARIDNECAVKVLQQAFETYDEEQREYLTVALGKQRVIEPLIDMLNSSDRLRRAAVEGLGASGDLRVVEPLIGMLASRDFVTRRKAARALGRLRSPRAVQPLTEALSDGRKEVRRAAAEALSKIEKAHPGATEPAVFALISLLDGKARPVQDSAAKALGRIQTAEAQEAVWRWRFPDT